MHPVLPVWLYARMASTATCIQPCTLTITHAGQVVAMQVMAATGCIVVRQGVYLEAFRRLYALLEESGWRVGKEGEEPQEELSLEQMGYLAG